MLTRRIAGWQQFVADTAAKREAARQNRVDAALPCAIPERFRGITLADFVRYTSDPEKRPAYAAAKTFVENGGWIWNGADTKKFGLTFMGPAFGIGKTGLASGAYNALAATRSGAWVYYPEFVHLCQKGYHDQAGAMLDAVRSVDVLLLDDLGRSEYTTPTPYINDIIKDIIGYRHLHLKITLITTNKNNTQITAAFGADTFQRIGELTKLVPMGGRMLRDLR